jgi:hypothetical protein
MGVLETPRTAALAAGIVTVTGIAIWLGVALGALIVTLPVKVPGESTEGLTVTAMVAGADPEAELIVSQLSAGAVLIVAEAV